MADPFAENAAWCTKQSWPEWHFYANSTTWPLCGSPDFNLLGDDSDVMVVKRHPDSGACGTCVRQGERAGLWHAPTTS